MGRINTTADNTLETKPRRTMTSAGRVLSFNTKHSAFTAMMAKIVAAASMVKPVAALSGPMQFPKDVRDVELDIVGLLAVVGEAAMADQVQPITASMTCMLPRLLPAPQSFLRTSRPWRLPPSNYGVIGIHSGNHSTTLNFFPEILHNIDELPRFTVRTISITRHNNPKHPHNSQGVFIRPWGPNNILAILGTFFSLSLIIISAILKDGMTLIAIVLLSVTSSIVGLANYWKVDLQKRVANRLVPPGDVVVVGRQGALLIVRCDESLARELYFGQERCEYYVGDLGFRFLAGVATFLFMAAVVFLASGTWEMQAAIGLSYIILNGAYWLVAALIPGKLQWDLRAYVLKEEGMETRKNYTMMIWEALKQTGNARWVRRAKLVPDTAQWEEWLTEAEENLGKEKETWDPEAALDAKMLVSARSHPPSLGTMCA